MNQSIGVQNQQNYWLMVACARLVFGVSLFVFAKMYDTSFNFILMTPSTPPIGLDNNNSSIPFGGALKPVKRPLSKPKPVIMSYS